MPRLGRLLLRDSAGGATKLQVLGKLGQGERQHLRQSDAGPSGQCRSGRNLYQQLGKCLNSRRKLIRKSAPGTRRAWKLISRHRTSQEYGATARWSGTGRRRATTQPQRIIRTKQRCPRTAAGRAGPPLKKPELGLRRAGVPHRAVREIGNRNRRVGADRPNFHANTSRSATRCYYHGSSSRPLKGLWEGSKRHGLHQHPRTQSAPGALCLRRGAPDIFARARTSLNPALQQLCK